MTKVEIQKNLREARKLITRGWCQHVGAQDTNGYACKATSSMATQWCAVGALDAVASDSYAAWELSRYLLDSVCTLDTSVLHEPILSVERLADWNDAPSRTKQEVLDAFDWAIAHGK